MQIRRASDLVTGKRATSKRIRLAAVIAIVATLGLTSAAYADRHAGGGAGGDNGSVDINAGDGSGHGGLPPSHSGQGSGHGSGGTTPTTAYVPPPCDETLDHESFNEYKKHCNVWFGGWQGGDQVLDPVPGQAADPAVAAAQRAATAKASVADYFQNVQLPKPKPKMSAVTGVAGAVHQLDLQMPATATFNDNVDGFGTLHVNSVGTFSVNWGDGTTDTFANTGAPWPNSSITHTWAKRGNYTIVVIARWRSAWNLAEYGGVVNGLVTTATIPNYQVGDIQSVIKY